MTTRMWQQATRKGNAEHDDPEVAEQNAGRAEKRPSVVCHRDQDDERGDRDTKPLVRPTGEGDVIRSVSKAAHGFTRRRVQGRVRNGSPFLVR